MALLPGPRSTRPSPVGDADAPRPTRGAGSCHTNRSGGERAPSGALPGGAGGLRAAPALGMAPPLRLLLPYDVPEVDPLHRAPLGRRQAVAAGAALLAQVVEELAQVWE